MKSKKVLILAIIFTLLTSIFAMSDDGANKPVIAQEKVKNKLSQVGNPNITEKTKSNGTAKDRAGIDTGLTQKKLNEFKKQYLETAETLGIIRNVPGYKENYYKHKADSYYNNKVNLNEIEKLRELGLFYDKSPLNNKDGFAYNLTNSYIILIGTIDSVEYFHKSKEEEWEKINKGALSRYFVKVDEILKGNEYFTNPPNTISYFSSIGKFITTSGDTQLKMGKKYILFFKVLPPSPKRYKTDLSRLGRSALGLEGNNIYFSNFKDKYIMSKDEVMSKIRSYERINNSNNFYKRKYINKEVHNEK